MLLSISTLTFCEEIYFYSLKYSCFLRRIQVDIYSNPVFFCNLVRYLHHNIRILNNKQNFIVGLTDYNKINYNEDIYSITPNIIKFVFLDNVKKIIIYLVYKGNLLFTLYIKSIKDLDILMAYLNYNKI